MFVLTFAVTVVVITFTVAVTFDVIVLYCIFIDHILHLALKQTS